MPLAAALLAEEHTQSRKIRFNASHCKFPVVREAAEARGWEVLEDENDKARCHVHFVDDGSAPRLFFWIAPWMRVNHIPGMYHALGRKTSLATLTARLKQALPDSFDFLPHTWVLPHDQYRLEKHFAERDESNDVYIVKPDNLAQGKGIFLTTELAEIQDASKKRIHLVVQQYISHPMLIEGMKFDLRLYMLVCRFLFDGKLRTECFLFRNGLVRLCTTAYDAPTAGTLHKKRMHLTNYAINKGSKHFEQNQDADEAGYGSKRSLKWFLKFFEQNHGKKARKLLWSELCNICVKTVLAAVPALDEAHDKVFTKDVSNGQMGCQCFHILGMDVMLDQSSKPYLLEVNTLPSFRADSPLDEDIKSSVIRQAFDIACKDVSADAQQIYESAALDARLARKHTPNAGRVTDRVAALIAKTAKAQNQLSICSTDYQDFEHVFPVRQARSKLAAEHEAILACATASFRIPFHRWPSTPIWRWQARDEVLEKLRKPGRARNDSKTEPAAGLPVTSRMRNVECPSPSSLARRENMLLMLSGLKSSGKSSNGEQQALPRRSTSLTLNLKGTGKQMQDQWCPSTPDLLARKYQTHDLEEADDEAWKDGDQYATPKSDNF